jgi:hypothetical protein
MSPYDGGSRRVLWIGLALGCAAQLVGTASSVASLAAGPGAHPLAPRFLLALGGSPAAWVAAAIGVLALTAFALRRAPLASGALALALLALVGEAHAALADGPRRHEFATGAALAGWLCGLAFARALRPGARPLDSEDDALAETGAVAALAATYVDAALSKLTSSGLGWTDALSLRAMLLTQRPINDVSLAGAWARAILEHPALAQALSLATLVVQLGAIAWAFDRRARVVCGLLILAFHFNVSVLTGIGYMGAVWLVVLFSFPWWRVVRARAEPPPPVEPRALRRATLRAVAVTAVLVALAWALPIRRYTALHYHHAPGERR